MKRRRRNPDTSATPGEDHPIELPTLPPEIAERMPAVIGNVDARLPDNYIAAVQAIEACERVDECRDWADKAKAVASYAKQAGDDALYKTARRIRLRAIRRCGELLREIESSSEANLKQGPERSAPTFRETRSDAARQAGMSERQQKTAVHLARIPQQEFEKAVESDDPPTVTALQAQGIRKRQRPVARVRIGAIIAAAEHLARRLQSLDWCALGMAQRLQSRHWRTLGEGERKRLDRALSAIWHQSEYVLAQLPNSWSAASYPDNVAVVAEHSAADASGFSSTTIRLPHPWNH